MSATPEPVTVVSLDLVVEQSGIAPEGALALKTAFAPFFAQAEEWRVKVGEVTDPKIARASRLTLKRIRVEAERTRNNLKEDSLKRGKAIDGLYNVIDYIVSPLEKRLLEIETAAERAEQARKMALCAERVTQLAAYGVNGGAYPLADMAEGDFWSLLENSKLAHEARAAAAAKAEADRIAAEKAAAEARAAKEKADAAERERLRQENEARRIENERLQKEAAAREEAARVEAARVAKAAKEAADRARRAREEVEAKAKAEREAAEAAAKVERERLAEIARVERVAREKLEAEAKAVRDREAARQAKEAEEAARAAAAPDKEKLRVFAELILAIELPEMTTTKGRAALAAINEEVIALAAFIRTKGGAL